MMKKIILAILLFSSCALFNVYGKSVFTARTPFNVKKQLVQSNKQAVAEALLRALVNNDADLLWQVLAPEIKQQGIDECGSIQKAKVDLHKAMLKGSHRKLKDQLKAVYNDPQARKKLINTICNTPKTMVRIDGKWYISEGIGNVMGEIRKMSPKIDQSSKEATCKTFAVALINDDMETFFAILPPELQKKILTEAGNDREKVLKSMRIGLQAGISGEKRQRIKKVMADPKLQKEYIKNLVQFADRKNAFVYTNGKWYVDTSKFDD